MDSLPSKFRQFSVEGSVLKTSIKCHLTEGCLEKNLRPKLHHLPPVTFDLPLTTNENVLFYWSLYILLFILIYDITNIVFYLFHLFNILLLLNVYYSLLHYINLTALYMKRYIDAGILGL